MACIGMSHCNHGLSTSWYYYGSNLDTGSNPSYGWLRETCVISTGKECADGNGHGRAGQLGAGLPRRLDDDDRGGASRCERRLDIGADAVASGREHLDGTGSERVRHVEQLECAGGRDRAGAAAADLGRHCAGSGRVGNDAAINGHGAGG